MAKSKFKVLMVVGGAVGIAAGGTVALFTSGGASTPPAAAPVAAGRPGGSPVVAANTPAAPPAPSPAAPPAISPDVPTPASSEAHVERAASPATTPGHTKATQPSAGSGAADDAASLNERGKNAMFSNDFNDASRLFERALLLDPSSAKIRFNLATTYFQLGRFGEAIANAKLIIAANQGQKVSAAAEKLIGKAVVECEAQGIECGRPRPETDVDDLYRRAVSLMSSGKVQDAQPLFDKARLLSREPKIAFASATNLFQLGEFDRALKALRELRQASPTAEQLAKADNLLGRILAECKAQNVTCTP